MLTLTRLGILREANCGLICLALHTADSSFLCVKPRMEPHVMRLNPIPLEVLVLVEESDSVVGLLLPHLAVASDGNRPAWLRVEP